jgi:hypothetical protein
VKKMKNEDMNFDTSDSPEEPTSAVGKKRPPPVPSTTNKSGASWDQSRRSSYNPGMPPRKNEATPFGGPSQPDRRARSRSGDATRPIPMSGPQVTPQQAAAGLQAKSAPKTAPTQNAAPAGAPPRRAKSDTSQFQMRPNTPLQAAGAAPAKTEPGESSWDVYVDGAGVYKVPAPDEQTAKTRAAEWLSSGGDPEMAGKKFAPNAFQAVRGESRQLSAEGLKHFHSLVNQRIQEIVRKKEGGGGYNLYSPNKGKKKNPKPVGEFPTRLAAKRAELARFPPKDPEKLKRARTRLDKLSKDPKKQQAAARKEMGAKGAKRSGPAAGDRKKSKKEALIHKMATTIAERLFHEDEVPGSPWDERISGMDTDSLSSDKKLHKLMKKIELASSGALGDGHKALAKVLRGLAKVGPGETMRDPDRGKMYMPLSMDVDGQEIGPIHLYVDGGNVCIEISQEAREMIGGLDPILAKELRGGLMSFQEDHLPKIDRARGPWSERDNHLDSLHQELERTVGKMSGVQMHLARPMFVGRRRR